ncbi:hypothetical protein B484DRAFT_163713 [Ochromonadaceae sp. CCMP2298]|nr:hypothetical protein B484DRAFT_163713 [Ochromonadaceae sp. CCMP2298]
MGNKLLLSIIILLLSSTRRTVSCLSQHSCISSLSAMSLHATATECKSDGGSGNGIGGKLVPSLDATRVTFLASKGVNISPLHNLGAQVTGVDLRQADSIDVEVIEALQQEMSTRGFLVFKEQGVLTGDEQVRASELWGGKKIHSTHGVHPAAPNEHIFRLSNDRRHGILGVGPQWHNDGSFLPTIFSHVGYHIVRKPEGQGATYFAHQVLPPPLSYSTPFSYAVCLFKPFYLRCVYI